MSDNNPTAADPFGQIADEFVAAFRQGKRPSVEEFARRYPQQADDIREMLPALELMEKAKSADNTTGYPAGSVESAPPRQIGRYRVERLLGKGGFGVVYLAHDDQLQRPVAIKVPHARLVAQATDAETYLTEARAVASLDHPNIVPVHDVGSTPDCSLFIVSKYIDGTDLATRLRQSWLSLTETVGLVTTVAGALHHAHRQGLVHRDIKPGNILLDKDGKAFVADFGLALREGDVGKGPCYIGTPAYMSPEQARGEGHRVDGRSDIFSLGVVFYELLAGRQPFWADSQAELLEQVTSHEPRPLRQLDDRIPKELERICFKALSKRASERYQTAKDLADDLRDFLAEHPTEQQSGPDAKGIGSRSAAALTQPSPTSVAPGRSGSTSAATPTSESPPIKIVPKGLRSFDGHDADFFLELLPGPRDREGLPESVRFWKTRIEEPDADSTFTVGLIYGPSGCGKSSLVKAGLLPRLSNEVLAVYLEATAEETEGRLLNGLRKRCPALPDDLPLTETLAALRRGQGIPVGKKVLIVLDQFEQWLHARTEEQHTELVLGLRQCDGGRVQCVVMVRDDFWLAVTRFMRELEVRLVDGHNNALADLFDPDHARKVLAAFGRALGRLPEKTPTAEQQEFLDQAIRGLAEEGKVVCVRLALFAEMMKGKPWTPAALKAVGGTEGVGVAFLEETFSAASAPPEHRYHQKAARAVLKALLPEAGTDIKGHMRSDGELLAASGYAARPGDFEDLIRILDREVRLLTPTDPEGVEQGAGAPRSPTERYYQLTHDYLVPALRDWLTRKQRETRRGRAELRLAERAALWNSKPENRHLPAWWEWANIRLYTRKRDWAPPQRRMMRQAGRYHALRGNLLALALALLALAGWWTHGALRARALVDTLVAAKTADVPELIHDLGPYRRWADPLLREKAAQEGLDEDKRLHVALALLPVDAGQADYLCDRLLTARGPKEVKAIRAVLHEQARDSATRFWPVLQSEGEGKARRLRAACALALFDADDVRWTKVVDAVARSLAGESVALLGEWAGLLQPVRGHLAQALVRRPVEADASGFQAFLAVLSVYPEEAVVALHGQLLLTLPPTARQEDREALAQQQARAGVALLHLGRAERVWQLLHQGEDPTRRTYLIHRCAEWGVDAGILANRLLGDEEKDPSIRQGLLLALGEYKADQRAEVARGPLVDRVLRDYRDHPDPGVHSSAEWLLRQWRMGQRLSRADRGLLEARPRRWPGEIAKPRWEVNGQGQTLAVIPAPGTFEIGSPPEEKGRFGVEEDRRRVRIDYPFAVGLKLVTVAEYKKFRPGFEHMKRYSPGEDTPVNGVNWYDAAAYCNWLSEAEGIPKDQWCYPPVEEIERAEKEKLPLKLPANFARRTGYRLPLEAEWEYACRAGTVTAWSHGSDEAMLGHYAWYSLNSNTMIHPVGTRKPNGLGLFDAHGNAWQWCQDENGVHDHVDKQDINDKAFRVLRCGSFRDGANYARSACRGGLVPTRRDYFIVFRVARRYR